MPLRRQSTVFSTKSRRAQPGYPCFWARRFPITAMIRPKWCLTTMRLAQAGVDLVRGAADDPRDGWWQRGDEPVEFFAQVPFGANLDRQAIRFLGRGPSFNEGRNPLG